MISSFDYIGVDMPYTEHYRLFAEAGFDTVMLWHGEDFGEEMRAENRPAQARSYGLTIENIHAPFDINYIWDDEDSEDARETLQNFLQCIDDCADYEIPALVIHADLSTFAPPICDPGLERWAALVRRAEDRSVNLAVENMLNACQVARATKLLEVFDSPRFGYCFDIGHHNICGDADWLTRWPNRLKALHLCDNNGIKDQHLLPFNGNIDWPAMMKQIVATGYKGAVSLEIQIEDDRMHEPSAEYIARAYASAVKVEQLWKSLI